MHDPSPFTNPHKARTGLSRLWHAGGYSLAGLRAGWHEKAFRQEALAALVLLPAACWLGQSWVEVALLAGSWLLVMVVELLNTGIEAAIDRIGPEWHAAQAGDWLTAGNGLRYRFVRYRRSRATA